MPETLDFSAGMEIETGAGPESSGHDVITECPDTSDKDAGGDRRGGHWVPIADCDSDRIANSQTPETYALCLAVWYCLLREASYKRSLIVVLSDSLLCKRTGKTKNTVRKATRILEGLWLLKSTADVVPGTRERESLVREIRPSVSPWNDGSNPRANSSQGSSENEQAPLGEKSVRKNCTDSYTHGGLKPPHVVRKGKGSTPRGHGLEAVPGRTTSLSSQRWTPKQVEVKEL